MEFTSLCSGSAANCIYIRGGNTSILVDAGCSCRYLERSLAEIGVEPAQISAILLTHEHSDHIAGAARISRRYQIPLFAGEFTWQALPFYQDCPPQERHVYRPGMEIGSLGLDFFALSHDAAQPMGLVVEHDGRRLGVVTDTGCVTPAMREALQDVDALVLEANHSLPMLQSGSYPAFLKRRIVSEVGHLSNGQAAELLAQVGRKAQAVLLAHLSHNNNTPGRALAEVQETLRQLQVELSCDFYVAARNQANPLISLI